MIEFTDEAKYDLVGIMAKYARENTELSIRFKEAVYAKVNLIKSNPLLYQKVYKNYRRVILKKFPYSIFYTSERNFTLIHAIVHQSTSNEKIKRLLN